MRTSCIHCGTELVRVAHWGVCPVCSADFLAAMKPLTIQEQLDALIGRTYLKEVGRPTINGVKT